MYYSCVLIGVGTEPLRHKNEYSPKSTRLFIFLKRAIFVINLGIYQYKSTFSTISAVIDSEIENVNEFA